MAKLTSPGAGSNRDPDTPNCQELYAALHNRQAELAGLPDARIEPSDPRWADDFMPNLTAEERRQTNTRDGSVPVAAQRMLQRFQRGEPIVIAMGNLPFASMPELRNIPLLNNPDMATVTKEELAQRPWLLRVHKNGDIEVAQTRGQHDEELGIKRELIDRGISVARGEVDEHGDWWPLRRTDDGLWERFNPFE